MSAGVLVIGAGQAAVQLACSLREDGYQLPITLVSDQPHAPYQRPPLSKAFLKGAASVESLAFRDPEFYETHEITLLTGERVVAVDRRDDGSGTAACASGRSLEYTRLVLATGAVPRRPPVAARGLAGTYVLETLDDATALRAGLADARDVVVIGGGFIGLEVAASARLLGRSVVVVETATTLMGRVVSPLVADRALLHHRRSGVDVRLGVAPTSIAVDDDAVSGVELDDGTMLPAQAVVLGVGVSPRVTLAEQLGLDCDDGIIVDSSCVASDGTTLAIGDCAVTATPEGAGASGRIRLESVDNATEQAKIAADTLMGRPRDGRWVPWFWSDQGDFKLQIAGLRHPTDHAVVRDYPDSSKLTVIHYREGRMVAAESANAPADFVASRKALGNGWTLDPARVADPACSLKSLLEDASRA